MVDRALYTSITGDVDGGMILDNIAEKVGILFDAMALKPTSVTNSGNDYTLTIDPVLDADVVEGMAFVLRPNSVNTGAVRARVGANPYKNVVKQDGSALAATEFATGTLFYLFFTGGEFRIIGGASGSSGGAGYDLQEFDTSGTWNKPSGFATNSMVIIENWGGGGGGSSNSNGGGGGGGGYHRVVCKLSDLTSSVSIAIGAAGALGGQGGDTSFGAYNVAYGGGGGNTNGAGGGGGATSRGANGTSSGGNGGGPDVGTASPTPAGSGTSSYGGGGGAGSGGFSSVGGGALFGGGGGGGGGSGNGGHGGWSAFGGGGGSGNGTSLAGQCLYLTGSAGNGGTTGVAGQVPGGGGGRNALGAHGRCRVTVIG